MILDRLDNAARYLALHPGFAAAFNFLRRPDLARLPAGRYPVEGEAVYALVAREKGRLRAEARLEVHHRYIDIQYVLSPGGEEMGWKASSSCGAVSIPYDMSKDIEFLHGAPDAWIPVGPGHFAVFFPSDAHAPLVGAGELHKVIVKVALSPSGP